jgi:2-oxoglutarate ferredoxin oxidoreductase subunit alpha
MATHPTEVDGFSAHAPSPKPIVDVDKVVIRFAGDSGDGMQLTGTQFTNASAIAGNDLATFPDFPAEIRAPAGSLAGVSGFQLNFSSLEVNTPGDAPDVLVAMNPAALRTNLGELKPGGILLCDLAAFSTANLKRAGYDKNPLEDGSLAAFQLYVLDITRQNELAVKDVEGLSQRERFRTRNFYCLGLMYWLYNRPMETTLGWINMKFSKEPAFLEANIRALKAGYNYGETADLFKSSYRVPAAKLAPGKYRNISGNVAAALGFIAAAQKCGKLLFLGSYPITPASDILHELSRYKGHGVITFQAEDEIAGVCSAIGAAFGGALGLTTTSGPGLALKSEAINLALMTELPLVITDIQRGGPSTGLPTKTEQADLLQACYGRNSESPVPVIAAATPSDCFFMAIEAFRLATKYMTPVIYLTDGYLANGSEPWKIPSYEDLPDIDIEHPTDLAEFPDGFFPYLRDAGTLARPWAIPGTPGFEHRIGGLEKQDKTGNVNYEAENHEFMVRIRAEKVARIAHDCPPCEVIGDDEGDLAVVGWGGTYGALRSAVQSARARGHRVSHIHVRHLFPFPAGFGAQLARFRRVLVAELNLGQLRQMVRAQFLIDAEGLNKVQGRPFKEAEVLAKIESMLKEMAQ